MDDDEYGCVNEYIGLMLWFGILMGCLVLTIVTVALFGGG